METLYKSETNISRIQTRHIVLHGLDLHSTAQGWILANSTTRSIAYSQVHVAWRTCMSLCRILRLVLCLVVVLIPGNATCSFPSKHACLFGCRSATWTAGCRSSWVVLFAAGEQSYVIPEGGLPLHEQAGGKCQLAESKRGFTEGHRHKCKPTSAHVKNAYYGMRR